jgi:enediyne biosynthesis protein E4
MAEKVLLRMRGLICGVLCMYLVGPVLPQVQKPAQPAQTGMNGGIASAGVFAPVYDKDRRPITAGGLVEKGTVVFEDVTQAAGLSGWRHEMGTRQKKYILETDGSGVGLITITTAGLIFTS